VSETREERATQSVSALTHEGVRIEASSEELTTNNGENARESEYQNVAYSIWTFHDREQKVSGGCVDTVLVNYNLPSPLAGHIQT